MTRRARPLPGRRHGDRGAGALDISVMGVCFFVPVILLVVYAGRMNAGHAAVESAARHAARTISIARDAEAGAAVAADDAAATVREGSAMCRAMEMEHLVEATQVTVTVTCDVDLSELVLLPVPGHESVSATAVEVVDRHREAEPT
jgi:hypothetical protein